MSKRGLSDVITTVLIILFAIVAVVIIGGIVLNQISKAGEKVKSQQLCLTNNIEVLNCMQVGTEARVKYRRATDNDVKSVQDLKVGLVYADGNNANPVIGDTSLGAGEVRIISFSSVPNDKVSSAFVASTFSATDGSKPTCVSPRITCVKGSVPDDFNSAGLQVATLGGSAANCNNNNVIDAGEACDGKNLNGKTCADAGFSGSSPANVPGCANCLLTQGTCIAPVSACTSCVDPSGWGAWSSCTSGQQTRTCITYPPGCTAPSPDLTQNQQCSSGSGLGGTLNDGLVAYYKLDETGSATTALDSVSQKSMTDMDANWVTGLVVNANVLQGKGGKNANIDFTALNPQGFTISFYVKRTIEFSNTYPDYGQIFNSFGDVWNGGNPSSRGNGAWSLNNQGCDTRTSLGVDLSDGTRHCWDKCIELPTNQWEILTMTMTSDLLTLSTHTNKVSCDLTNMALNGGVLSFGGDLVTGTPTSDRRYAKNIAIDGIGVWNRVLTAEEKTALWNNGNGISYS